MNGNVAMEDDRQMLKGIIALLFALAVLAERLCDVAGPVRMLVLWAMRSAETVTQEFVVDMADEHGLSVTSDHFAVTPLPGGDSTAEAMRLAGSFRALGVLLQWLLDASPENQRIHITPAAWAAIGQLTAAMILARRLLCLDRSRFTVARSDSS